MLQFLIEHIFDLVGSEPSRELQPRELFKVNESLGSAEVHKGFRVIFYKEES